MKTMALWAGVSAVLGFILLFVCFNVARPNGPDHGVAIALSIMGAIPAAAMGALFAAVNVIQNEMRETRRELKHWQSIQQLDIELDKPSTHIKPAPPSGRN